MNTTETKKKSKVGAIFFGLLILLIYLALVSIPQLVVMVPILVQASMESMAAFDPITQMDAYMQNYMDTYMTKMAENSAAITTATAIGTLVAVIAMVIWYYFGIYRKNKKISVPEPVLPKLKNVKSILFIVLGSIACYALAIIIYEALAICMPRVMSVYEQSMSTAMGGVVGLGAILAVILAPIGEETALRGIVMNRAKKSFGLIGCMVLSGILFGIFHMNPIQGLYAIPIGMFYGFVAYKFKSVIPSIICHFINNLLSMLASGLFSNAIIDIIIVIVFGVAAVLIGRKVDFFKEAKEPVNE